MKKRFFLLIPILIIQILPIKLWNLCKNFLDYYHFSSYDLELQLIYAINHDYELPIIVARIFHNKASQFAIDFYKRYTHFFDWQLFITSISLVGVIGFLFGIWYFLSSSKKDKRIGIVLVLAFVLPVFEVLFNPNLPFFFKFLLIFTPFHLVSLYGHYRFIKAHKIRVSVIVYILLLILSLIWILLMPDQSYKYCLKI